jgi:protein-L-isoaspartate O-methyltransferase
MGSLGISDTLESFYHGMISKFGGYKFFKIITFAMTIMDRGLFVSQDQSQFEISRAYNDTPVALRFDPRVNLSISSLHFEALHAFYEHFEDTGKRPLRILDVGMGSGYVLFVLNYLYPEAQCVGVEIYKDIVERGKELIPVIQQRLQTQEEFWKNLAVTPLEYSQQYDQFWKDHRLHLDLRNENIFNYINQVCKNSQGQVLKTFDIIHGGALVLDSKDREKVFSVLSPGGVAVFPFSEGGQDEMAAFYKDKAGKIYKKKHLSWVIYTPLVHSEESR